MTDARLKYPTMSRARLKMLNEPGLLYAAYSGFCDWIKIGFTSKPAAERLDGLNRQYALFAPFSLIGATPSTHAVEQQLHRALKPLRLYRTASTGELYPASKAMVEFVKWMLEVDQRRSLAPEGRLNLWRWARQAAEHPLNRAEVEFCFHNFRRDQDPLLTGRAA